jgi:NADH:ubiquinone oxidoreductase subunit 3 (subunit A)
MLVKHHRGNNLHPVESGFIGYSGGYTSFSMHFFLILLIFVLFDVEIIFMVLVPNSSIEDFVGLTILLSFIYGTLFYERKISKLIWFYRGDKIIIVFDRCFPLHLFPDFFYTRV